MPLTPEDVRAKQFATTRLREGYDENEVDAFLDEVEAELTRLLRDNATLVARNADLEQQLAAARVKAAAEAAGSADGTPAPAQGVEDAPEQAALRIITIAQRTADEAVADARLEAEQVLGAARREADQALAEARACSAALEQETRDKHQSIVSALEAQRERLERRVADLEAFDREHRRQLKTYLEGQLRELEAREEASRPPRLGALPLGEPDGLADRDRREPG